MPLIPTPDEIDALLPQTQCGLCGYGGCMPYAEAMAFDQAPIHLCPPGGVKTLHELGMLLNQDPKPYVNEMEQKAKPPLVAVIREAECIGCTKCIQACPIDAIIGSAKEMHTIIASDCTGCELCVAPCPVDCIDLVSIHSEETIFDKDKIAARRKQYAARTKRLAKEKVEKKIAQQDKTVSKKRNYIAEAIARAKLKKLEGKNPP